MTNRTAAVSDGNSSIAVAISAKQSALFPPLLVQKNLVSSSGHFSVGSRRFCPKKLEVENGGSCGGSHAWVDSMRASSPVKKSSEAEEYKSWITNHPSALDSFEDIWNAAQGKQIVVFLDYDGTLSPIVDDPDRAFMSPEMREAVKEVAKNFPTAIVSGRCRAKVHKFVKLSELYYVGSHGMDIKGPTTPHPRNYRKGHRSVLFQPAREFLPMMDEVYKSLLEKTKSTLGAKVENNKFCLSVHFRLVDEKEWTNLAENVKSVLKEYPKLRLTQGRKVLEIRPTIKWDKGRALEFLLASLGYADSTGVLPIYVGDDRTDEDAFKVLRKKKQGFGILVSKFPKETDASYSLQELSEVMCFLRRLVAWTRSSARED